MTTNVTSTTIAEPDRLRHVPTPAGAVGVDDWYLDNDAKWYRQFRHADHETRNGNLMIRGTQCEDSTTDRGILLRSDDDELTPGQARRLASMLQNFADSCELLDGEQR